MVEETTEKTGGESREPSATEKAASKNRDPSDPGAKSYVTVREKPTVIFAVPDLKELAPMGYLRIDLPKAYRRQDCKLASSSFEPLCTENSEIRKFVYSRSRNLREALRAPHRWEV